MNDVTPIGMTNFRNKHVPFGIKDIDRLNHVYAIGKTGTGKSTLLLTMAISDIQRGNGVCLIDPHGDIAERILQYIPKSRVADVVYVNPADPTHIVGFSPFDNINPGQEHLVVAGLLSTFKKIWADSWGPRLEYILRFALLTLCFRSGSTLLDIQQLLTNAEFRKRVVASLTDSYILSFWHTEFNAYSPQVRAEAISSILNKTGVFIAITQLRNVVGQTGSAFSISHIMEQKKILICNLSKGNLGEDATTVIGSMIVNAIQLAALARASQEEEQRIPFYLYVDEMHSFISLSFADILAESRKYRLSLFLTHQYLEQVNEKIRAAILGNVGTMIFFRIGAEDAALLAKEVYPPFSAEDLVALPRFSLYIKLMIDGATSKPFSALTHPIGHPQHNLHHHVIQQSRERYARAIHDVEADIRNRYTNHQTPDLAEYTLFSH